MCLRPRFRAASLYPGCPVQPVEQIQLVFAGRGRWREAEKVGRGEGKAAQVCGQADQEALPGDLRAMGKQGLALDLAVGTDIERHRRRLGAWATGMVPPSLQPSRVDTRRGARRPQSIPAAVVDLRD